MLRLQGSPPAACHAERLFRRSCPPAYSCRAMSHNTKLATLLQKLLPDTHCATCLHLQGHVSHESMPHRVQQLHCPVPQPAGLRTCSCGAMSHKTKDCMERPRSKGARWTGKHIAADEKVEDIELDDFDAKRDRWSGYDSAQYSRVIDM